jgi:colanic acid biosynthesis glycosyl transferase WcaI
LRILMLSQFFDPEPVTIPGMAFARWLCRQGHEVEVVTGFPNYPTGRFYPHSHPTVWRREHLDGIRINRVLLYPSHGRSAVGRVANYGTFALSASTLGTALIGKADAIYVYHPPATVGLAALVWKLLLHIPFVYHIQDIWPDSVIESGMIRDGAARKLVEVALASWCGLMYSSASRIVAQSPGFKRILVERGVPDSKIEVVYNWTEESIFNPVQPDPVLAEELGMSSRFNLVFAGNIGHFQGLDTAVEAAGRLRHLKRFQLVIVGTGQAEHHLRNLAATLGADNVCFLGQRPFAEMTRINALASALLVSLQDRSFFAATIPSKTQVGLASGRPLLMAVRGDAADLVHKAGAGVVCPPDDVAGLISAIEQLYSRSDTELDSMGARGRDFYVRELSMDRGARRIESLLTAAAGEGVRGWRHGLVRRAST